MADDAAVNYPVKKKSAAGANKLQLEDREAILGLEKAMLRIKALDCLRNTVDQFPKTGQGYKGIGIVEPEDIKMKTEHYLKIVFHDQEVLKTFQVQEKD